MLRDIAPKSRSVSVRSARRLRREMTLPEVILWDVLRKRPAGLKFRRQHPVGGYVIDFYCGDARLAIEVDGEAHERGQRPQRDAARDRWLVQYEVATFRVPVCEVLRDVGAVADAIVSMARGRLPLHHPASPGGPPPRDKLGED